MRLATLLVLASISALAQGNTGQSTTGVSRGNGLRIPQYRTPGTGARSYFVDPTGSDSNACTASGTSACLTIQGAINKIPKLLRDQVTVNVAAGNYAGFILSGFTVDNGIQQTTGGILIDGALTNSTLATGSATGTAAGAGQSAGSGTTFGTLCDSGATWTVNDLTGRFLTTTLPTNTAVVIASNTATCITAVGTLSLPVAGQTTYAIQDPSVIITSNASEPASVTAASNTTRGAVHILGNNVNYRSNTIVLRSMRVANTTGTNSVDINDNSAITLSQMQLRPTAANATGITMSGVTTNTACTLFLSSVDINAASSTVDSVGVVSGVFVASRLLIRAPTGSAGIAINNTAKIQSLTSVEITGVTIGLQAVSQGNDSVPITGLRVTCASGAGTGLRFGSSTVIGAGKALGPINSFNVATCGTGIDVYGYSVVDVVGMTGAAATTGIAVNHGGMVTFTKAGTTITAGTNEINLDSGGATAAFADVAAGTCLASEPQNSKVCGR